MTGTEPSVWGWSWSRLRTLDHRIVDPVLAAALLVVSLLTMLGVETDAQHPTPINWFAYVLTVVGFAALALRTRRPLAALVVCMGVTTWFALIEYPENGLPIACLVALYTVGALSSRRAAAIAALGVAGIIVGLTAVGAQGLTIGSALGNLAMFGVAYALGSYVGVRRAYLSELELRVEATDENRRRAAEQAVTVERLRIARELHDVVAHAMSVVAVQSGVAAHVIDQDPDQARTMLRTINGTSRQALAEMRRLLGVLRSETDGDAELAPSPSLADLPMLVASMEGTGVTVDLDLEGTPPAVAPGVELAAFRIVQEALTNVVRHAGPSHVDVTVRYGADGVAVEVVDDGRGAAAAVTEAGDEPGGGHGLVGMRERVDVYGGSLAAGPRPGGGFAVSATLPYDAAGVAS